MAPKQPHSLHMLVGKNGPTLSDWTVDTGSRFRKAPGMWRPQAYFALAAALLFALDLWGAVRLPSVFSSEFAQHVLGNGFIFCFVGAAYFSVRCSLRNGRHHAINLLVIAACIATASSIAWHYLRENRNAAMFAADSYRQGEERAEILKALVRDALHNSDPQEREKRARAAARVFGVQVAYADSKGLLTVYESTDDDKKVFAQLDMAKGPRDAELAAIDRRLAAVPTVGAKIIAWGGIFFLAFLGGDVLRDGWRRGKKPRD